MKTFTSNITEPVKSALGRMGYWYFSLLYSNDPIQDDDIIKIQL